MSETAVFHMLDGNPITDNCRLVVIEGPVPGGDVQLTPEAVVAAVRQWSTGPGVRDVVTGRLTELS